MLAHLEPGSRRVRALTPIAHVLDAQRAARIASVLDAHADDVDTAQKALAEPASDGSHRRLEESIVRLLAALREGDRPPEEWDRRLRSDALELIDRDDVPAWAKNVTMRFLNGFNLAVGNNLVFRSALDRALGASSEAHVYDLAAGSGGFALWLAEHPLPGRKLRLTTSDVDERFVEIGGGWKNRGGVTFEVRDALDLSGVTGVDLFTCIQAAHHLGPARVVRMIHTAVRAAPLGILIIDVYRGVGTAVAVAAVSMLAPFPIFVHDAFQSVRRSYTPAELALLARVAGATSVESRAASPAYCVLHAHR